MLLYKFQPFYCGVVWSSSAFRKIFTKALKNRLLITFHVKQTSQVYEDVCTYTAFFRAAKFLERLIFGNGENDLNMPKGLDILLTTKKAIILALFSQFHGVGNFRNVHGKKKI